MKPTPSCAYYTRILTCIMKLVRGMGKLSGPGGSGEPRTWGATPMRPGWGAVAALVKAAIIRCGWICRRSAASMSADSASIGSGTGPMPCCPPAVLCSPFSGGEKRIVESVLCSGVIGHRCTCAFSRATGTQALGRQTY